MAHRLDPQRRPTAGGAFATATRRAQRLALLWLAALAAGCDDEELLPPGMFESAATATAEDGDGEPPAPADDGADAASYAAPTVAVGAAGGDDAGERTAAEPVAKEPELRVYQTGPVRGARLGGSSTTHDWGVAEVGAELKHTFVLYNSGDRPLQIRRASPTLGCARVRFDREIEAGGSGEFVVTLPTAKLAPGRTSVTIALETSDRRADVTLFLAGRLEAPGTAADGVTPSSAPAAAAAMRTNRGMPRAR